MFPKEENIMPTPHINAKDGDFAKVVLMPGDPLRAKFVAETYLTDARLVTSVRGAFGYTGHTKNGKLISVMASGMGMPSIGIYSHELYTAYGVDAIIRIGTSGSYQPDINLKDVVIAQGACTDSAWSTQYRLDGGTYSAISDYEMLETAVAETRKRGLPLHVGNVLSADNFYNVDPDMWKRWAGLGVLAVEMEAYALFSNAARLGKKALAIFTISDSFLNDKILTPEERQVGLTNMIEIAIATAEKFA